MLSIWTGLKSCRLAKNYRRNWLDTEQKIILSGLSFTWLCKEFMNNLPDYEDNF